MDVQNLETIKFELRENGVGILTLNRPDKLNAVSFQMIEDLHSILNYLQTQLDCRVLHIQGKCTFLMYFQYPLKALFPFLPYSHQDG